MIITASNQAAMKHDIYVHDSKIRSMDIDYAHATLTIKLTNAYSKKAFWFKFNGLLYFEMIALKLWAINTDEVLDFEIMDAVERNEKLHQLMSTDCIQLNSDHVTEFSFEDALLCCFHFSSGDRFQILCKTIEFNSSELVS